jgi:peptidoglycan hydrolase-like protein with peptidoglycan-binding domain
MAPTLTDNAVAAYAFAAGFTGDDLAIAVAVAIGESTCNPYAANTNVNHSVDYGVWQINTIHPDVLAIGNWRDPAVNARMARIVWMREGWNAWMVYKHNTYLQYMDRGRRAAESVGMSGAHIQTMYRVLRLATPYEQGSDVTAVQKLVGAVPLDGVYGPVTEGYVKKWQHNHKLVVDGAFGPKCCLAAGWLFKVDPHR